MQFSINDFTLLEVRNSQKREIVDYGIKMVGAPLEWTETMGKGIKVGIIDTGIDLKHEDLKYRVREVINTTSSNRKDVTDKNGHGTHVAGIIAAEKNGVGVVGVAPESDLYIVKAFKDDGLADFEAIKEGIAWLIEKRVDVINMSFSSKSTLPEYQKIINEAYTRGISLVCAAGNDGYGADLNTDTIEYPAKFDETIAVIAVDINERRADFSAVGLRAEIAAAGKNIYSCFPSNKYAVLSGTSMAAPIITGAVAILQAKAMNRYKRKLTPSEIKLILQIYTENLGKKG